MHDSCRLSGANLAGAMRDSAAAIRGGMRRHVVQLNSKGNP